MALYASTLLATTTNITATTLPSSSPLHSRCPFLSLFFLLFFFHFAFCFFRALPSFSRVPTFPGLASTPLDPPLLVSHRSSSFSNSPRCHQRPLCSSLDTEERLNANHQPATVHGLFCLLAVVWYVVMAWRTATHQTKKGKNMLHASRRSSDFAGLL